MAQSPQLIWRNPHPTPHFTINARMLAHLSDAVADRLRSGQLTAARSLMSLYALSPIAVGVVASRLSRAGIPEAQVLALV